MRPIDGDALVVAVLDHGVDHVQTDDLEEINQIINDAPTVDAVPVVRCEKCMHRGSWCGLGVYVCNKMGDIVTLDFYCGYGKREEDKKTDEPDRYCADGKPKKYDIQTMLEDGYHIVNGVPMKPQPDVIRSTIGKEKG